ncbi:hypothetical protein D9758_008533 [Tetrapyrgos nigripes]|uniref:C2H2-type domain-containing protein n=1 Tax=Tetrapyrgos nigripes TaxID=182062 RepID=A0A8H5G5I2_9AGAR|nr:hypothetical protein D9758_008533 [Tetrapyrgos nigripes]
MASAVTFSSSPAPRIIHDSQTVQDMNVAFHSCSPLHWGAEPVTLPVPNTSSLITELGGSFTFSFSTDIVPTNQHFKHGSRNLAETTVGPLLTPYDRDQLLEARILCDPMRLGNHQPLRLIEQSELFDVEGFEQWVQGVKQKRPVHAYIDHDGDNDRYIPVYSNTAVTNGLYFDVSGCKLATRQRHNSDASLSMNPRDCHPTVPFASFSDNAFDDDAISCVSSTSSSMDVDYPSPSQSTLGKRKILPLPDWTCDQSAYRPTIYHQTDTRSIKTEVEEELALLPKKKKTKTSKSSPQARRNSSSLPFYSSSRLLGPRTRANPNSEQIALSSGSITRNVPVKSKTIKYRRAPTVFSDGSDTSASESEPVAVPAGTFQCYASFCKHIFEDLDEVKEHFELQHSSKTTKLDFIRCPFVDCTHKTANVGDMSRHELVLAHQPKSFKCMAPHCHKSFTRIDALKRHWKRYGHQSQSRRAKNYLHD